MSEMVERVARAIQHMHDTGPKEHYLAFARAAIEAMREPTPEMYSAAAYADWLAGDDAHRQHKIHAPMDAKWRAMIDAALKGRKRDE